MKWAGIILAAVGVLLILSLNGSTTHLVYLLGVLLILAGAALLTIAVIRRWRP